MTTKSECCGAELFWMHCDECDPAHDFGYCSACQKDLVA